MQDLFSSNWRESIVDSSSTIFDVLKALSKSGLLLATFVDDDGILKGILTDIDLRKALIRGYRLEEKASAIANTSPLTANYHLPSAQLKVFANESKIHEIPLVDEEGKLRDIFIVNIREERIPYAPAPETKIKALPNAMFILAGGLGSRLSPVLSDRPKSLAPIAARPILARVIEQGLSAGIRKFYVSVNYMADKVIDFLKSKEFKDLDIHILEETQRMGTAGSLSLIPEPLKEPMLVCNSDVLTTARLNHLLLQHQREQAELTCAIRPHFVSIPYGVFQVQNGLISEIAEKPQQSFLVNAGIYVMNAELTHMIPKNTYFDMPDLIKLCLEQKRKLSPFYLHEYWIDIGKPDDYEKANLEYAKHFTPDEITYL